MSSATPPTKTPPTTPPRTPRPKNYTPILHLTDRQVAWLQSIILYTRSQSIDDLAALKELVTTIPPKEEGVLNTLITSVKEAIKPHFPDQETLTQIAERAEKMMNGYEPRRAPITPPSSPEFFSKSLPGIGKT